MGAPETHVHRDTPLPAPRRTAVQLDGYDLLYFYVPKGSQYIHLTSDGRCLKRVDRDSIPISAEQIAAKRLEDHSRIWDRNIENAASLRDLDVDLIQSVASQIAYGISPEKCLQYLDLAEFTQGGLKLKKAAMLLFAKDVRRWHPRCQIRIMTVRGNERQTGENFNVVKDETVADNLLKLVDTAWERLTLALSQHTQLTETARFEQNLLYPQIACREALINSIVHRNYAIEGRGIEIFIFQDRMEITNPGMLLSTISLADIKALKGAHESRNPLIARVLREVGLVREMGEGIRRIYDVMRSNALAEPEIESDTAGFTVTLHHKSLYDPNVGLWLSNFDSFHLTQNETAVMALGYAGKVFSTQDVIDRLGIVDTDQVRQILTPLRAKGIIEKIFDRKGAYTESRRLGIPKRELGVWKVAVVAEPRSTGSIRQPARMLEEPTLDEQNTHELFIGAIPYAVSRDELFRLLSDVCDILELRLPPNQFNRDENKGFAFAVVEYGGTTTELLRRLEGKRMGVRMLHFRDNRRH